MGKRDNLKQFFFAAMSELGIPVHEVNEDLFLLNIPPKDQAELDCGDQIYVTFSKDVFQHADESNVEFVTPGSQVLNWIIERIRKLGCVFHASHSWDEMASQQFLDKVVAAYEVGNGTVSVDNPRWISGLCIRFSYLLHLHCLESRDRLIQIVIDDQGRVIKNDDLRSIASLRFREPESKPSISMASLNRLIEVANSEVERARKQDEQDMAQSMTDKRLSEEKELKEYFLRMKEELTGLQEVTQSTSERGSIQEQIDSVERQMKQRLEEIGFRFSISSESRFVGALLLWHPCLDAMLVLRSGPHKMSANLRIPCYHVRPPAVVCMKSGKPTWHLAVTQDGRFVDAALVSSCSESGKIMPKDELVICSVSGHPFCPEFIAECPILLKPVQREALVQCPECLQLVSPRALKRKLCQACAERKMVEKTDARVTEILGRYPKLKSWSKWSLSETRDIYNLEITGALNVVRLVLRKSDLGSICCAKRSRLLGSWKCIDFAALVSSS